MKPKKRKRKISDRGSGLARQIFPRHSDERGGRCPIAVRSDVLILASAFL